MNYFQELLESYDHLKKRTLKVRLPRLDEVASPHMENGRVMAQKAIQDALQTGQPQQGVGNRKNITVTPKEDGDTVHIQGSNIGGPSGKNVSARVLGNKWGGNWTHKGARQSDPYVIAAAFAGGSDEDEGEDREQEPLAPLTPEQEEGLVLHPEDV